MCQLLLFSDWDNSRLTCLAARSANGLRVKLAEQPFLALVILLGHSGETVTREELREKLWRPNAKICTG